MMETSEIFPASAVGLQAESTPVDSTGSNPEDRGEFPSASPVVPVSDVQLMRPIADGRSAPISQAGEPISRIIRADTGMSASKRERRPDDASPVYHPCDEAIYSAVRVEQTRSDFPVNWLFVAPGWAAVVFLFLSSFIIF